MSKPKNIPADVDAEAWEAAADAMASVGWFATSMIRGAYSAILAAKAEEREDIWAIAVGNVVGERELEKMAREAGDAEGCLLHALLARENEQLAAAIRKRGEG